MVTFFRKLLIRLGKVIPFAFAFIVSFGYCETIYAVANDYMVLDTDGDYIYNIPITFFLGNIVYIDWFDVLLLYVLAVALEFCWRNMLAVHYLLLNLAVRTLTEHFYLDWWIVVGLAGFMALAGLYCIYGGLKILFNSRK